MKEIFSKASESKGTALEKAAAESAPARPLHLAFSLVPDALPASLVRAPGRVGPGLEPAGPPVIEKIGAKYRHEDPFSVDFSRLPLLAFSRSLLFKGGEGERLTNAHLGRFTPLVYDDGVARLAAGVDRYNFAGGKFLWLVEGRCAVNLALVTNVTAVSLGRKIRLEFAGGAVLWRPPKRAQVRQAVARFAQARTHARADIRPAAKAPAPSSGPGAP